MGDIEEELSPQKISKSTWGKILTSPWTLFPAAGGGLGLLAYSVLAVPFGIPIGLGGLTLSASYMIINGFFRFDKLKEKEKKLLQRLLEEKTTEKRQVIKSHFDSLGCRRGAIQLERLHKAFDGLKELIKHKFSNDNIMHDKYHDIVKKVYLNGLDHLDQVVPILQSIKSIDAEALTTDLQTMDLDDSSEASIKKRINLREQGELKVESLLSAVENAITGIEETTLILAKTKTTIGRTSSSIETSMEELDELSTFSSKLDDIWKASDASYYGRLEET